MYDDYNDICPFANSESKRNKFVLFSFSKNH